MSQNDQNTGKPLSTSNSSSDDKISYHRPSHSRKAGLEFSALIALVAVIMVGFGLQIAGLLPPYLVVFAGSVGAFLALLAAFGLSLFEKLWNSLRNKWRNSNHLCTILVSTLAGLLALAIVYAIPYSLSDPYYHTAKPFAVVNDPLLDNNKGNIWSEGMGQYGTCTFTSEVYQVSTLQGQDHFCIAGGTDFNNFVYEVQMTIIQGNCGGITFRTDLEHAKEYYFNVCLDHQDYCFARFDSKPSSSSKPDPLMGCNTPLPQFVGTLKLKQPIIIAIIANDINFQLFVNNKKKPITKAFDQSQQELKQGQIGVLAGSYFNPINCSTIIQFSNAKVWAL